MRWLNLALSLFASIAAYAAEPPDGWRLPTASELASEPQRAQSPTKYTRVVADFNGDGIDDEALLLKSTQFSGEGLWVRLSDLSTGLHWLKLSESRWGKKYPTVDLGMGIEVVQPGVVAYACFDTSTECDWSDRQYRPKLKLRDPALMFFKFESAASIFFWSAKHQRFLRVWVSD